MSLSGADIKLTGVLTVMLWSFPNEVWVDAVGCQALSTQENVWRQSNTCACEGSKGGRPRRMQCVRR